jgi:hypothetical protein
MAASATLILVENDFHFQLDEYLLHPDNSFSLVLKKRKGRVVTSNAPLGLRGSQNGVERRGPILGAPVNQRQSLPSAHDNYIHVVARSRSITA